MKPPWEQPGYEPLTLSKLRKQNEEAAAAAAKTEPVKKSSSSFVRGSDGKWVKRSRAPIARGTQPVRRARRAAAGPRPPAVAASPASVIQVVQPHGDDSGVAEALTEMAKVLRRTVKPQHIVVNVDATPGKTKTTPTRDEEGFIVSQITEPVKD